MACPQWTAMSQHPASLPTTLPPKCHPTWGTAPPRRPMWPDPRGSQPVAMLYLPTAVTLPPRWPSRGCQPTMTPSTQSPPRCCEVNSTDWWEKGGWEGMKGSGLGERRRGHSTPSLSVVATVFHSHCQLSMKDSAPGLISAPLGIWCPSELSAVRPKTHNE